MTININNTVEKLYIVNSNNFIYRSCIGPIRVLYKVARTIVIGFMILTLISIISNRFKTHRPTKDCKELHAIFKKTNCNFQDITKISPKRYLKIYNRASDYWKDILESCCEKGINGNMFLYDKEGYSAYAKAIALYGDKEHPIRIMCQRYRDMIYLDSTDEIFTSVKPLGISIHDMRFEAVVIDKKIFDKAMSIKAGLRYGNTGHCYIIYQKDLPEVVKQIEEDKLKFIEEQKRQFGNNKEIDLSNFQYSILGNVESMVYLACNKRFLSKYIDISQES